MCKRFLVTGIICLLAVTSAQATTLTADFNFSGSGSPSSGNTGMGFNSVSGGSPGTSGWQLPDFYVLNEIGNGPTTPGYRLQPVSAEPGLTNATLAWRSVELVARIDETETPDDPRSSYGMAAEVNTLSHKYLVGLRVKDNGGSFTTTVDIFDNQTGGLTHPPLRGSHSFNSATNTFHTYNVELNASNLLDVYVDGSKVLSDLTPGFGAGAVDLAMGDLRGSWGANIDPQTGQNDPAVFPNARGHIDRITFSTEQIIPEPATIGLLLTGGLMALRRRRG